MSSERALPGPAVESPAPLQVVERISRQARSIRVEVRPDGEVRLVIPRFVSRGDAYAFLRSREVWVRDKLAELRNRAQQARRPPLRWDGSDSIPLAGRETPVRLVPAIVVRPRVRLGEAIEVLCPPAVHGQHAFLATTLRAALRAQARVQALLLLQQAALAIGVDWSGPRIADQKSLWGSCTAEGQISLNWRLLLAPPEVFRYVVIHELCHRRHLDHSARFWTLVERHMPEYAGWRAWLRQQGASLHQVLPKR